MKRILSAFFLGLTASLLAMQKSFDIKIEQVANEFHDYYAKVRPVIEKINTHQSLATDELISCEKNLSQADQLLKIARTFLDTHGDSMTEESCYRCADCLGVPELAPFESMSPSTRFFVLKTRIATQVMRLENEIFTQCPMIIEGYKAESELGKTSETLSGPSCLQDIVGTPIVGNNCPKDKSVFMRRVLVGAGCALAGVGLSILTHYPWTRTPVKVSLSSVIPVSVVAQKSVSRHGVSRHIAPVIISALFSGIWAVKRSIPVDVVHNFFNFESIASWSHMFFGM